MDVFFAALQIFLLRICDVSIGTVRVIYTVRGRRLVSFCLGLIESGVFITAISRVFKDLHSPWKMVGYALGFATGTALGITLERWIGSGWVIARIISREPFGLTERLRSEGFGVTTVHADGKDGQVLVLFVVTARRRSKHVLALVDQFDPDAFVTIDPTTHARGGYVPHTISPLSVSK
jgi:uncharacterized protein YebE (UPF0316 family)